MRNSLLATLFFVAGCPVPTTPTDAGSDAPAPDAAELDAPIGPATYAIADWQVRCDSAMLGCTPGPSRLVTGLDGEMGNVVSCIVTESATERQVDFVVGSEVGGVSFSLGLQAVVPRAGGSPGAGCVADLDEGGTALSGVCGGAAPSTSQPCQVTLAFDADPLTGSPRLTAELLCDHLPLTSDPTVLRSVFQGAGSTSPAHIELFDCVGLSASL